MQQREGGQQGRTTRQRRVRGVPRSRVSVATPRPPPRAVTRPRRHPEPLTVPRSSRWCPPDDVGSQGRGPTAQAGPGIRLTTPHDSHCGAARGRPSSGWALRYPVRRRTLTRPGLGPPNSAASTCASGAVMAIADEVESRPPPARLALGRGEPHWLPRSEAVTPLPASGGSSLDGSTSQCSPVHMRNSRRRDAGRSSHRSSRNRPRWPRRPHPLGEGFTSLSRRMATSKMKPRTESLMDLPRDPRSHD